MKEMRVALHPLFPDLLSILRLPEQGCAVFIFLILFL